MYRIILGYLFVLFTDFYIHSYKISDEEYYDDVDDVTLNQVFGINPASRRANRGRRLENILDIESLTEEGIEQSIAQVYEQLGETEDERAWLRRTLGGGGEEADTRQAGRRHYRREGIPYKAKKLGSKTVTDPWREAQLHTFVVKATDNVLQLLFMMRHKVREVESHPTFDMRSPTTRLANLYVRMKIIARSVQSVMSRMEKSYIHVYWEVRDQYPGLYTDFNYTIFDFTLPLAMHSFAVAMHTEFMYLFYVFARVHESVCNYSHVYYTRPPSPRPTKSERTGGLGPFVNITEPSTVVDQG